jgi:hypothetical protein
MDVRRLNDVLKIAGAVVAALALFSPVLAKEHATIGALISDLLAVLPGALGAFAAGMGTRGFGLEYKDVAEAKVMAKVAASMAPPALSDRPTVPSTPPVAP